MESPSKSRVHSSRASLKSRQGSDKDMHASLKTARTASITSYPASIQQQLPRHHWCKHWWNHSTTGGAPKSSTYQSRAVWAGRILFVLVLVTVATAFSGLAFHLLTEDEANLAETQFRYISERALVEAKDALLARRWAGVTMADFVAELYPQASVWPFVEWLGFEQVVKSMLITSHGNDMGFVPFVTLEQRPAFEAFAQTVYRKLGFPNTTGVISEEIGFGIYARDKSVKPPAKYHDTEAWTPYDSPNEILAPIFRTDEGAHPVLMFNPHSQPFTGQAIDQLLACSHKRRDQYQDQIEAERNNAAVMTNSTTTSMLTMPPNQCGVISDIFHNVKLGGRWSVANFLPIYPRHDPLTVVGYIPSIFIVDELLDNVFAKDISGIDAVFESDARSVSYTIVNGVAEYVGEGQFYDRKHTNQMQSIQLIDPELNTDGAPAKSFKFYLYPNDDFYEVYQTQNPAVASIAVALSIVLTILVFLLYDFFVRKEFHAKRELLEARRQFMRFVSHEVRTPLNAVSMGLDLMQSEVARALGYASATCMRASQHFDEAHSASGDHAIERMEQGGVVQSEPIQSGGRLKSAKGACSIPPRQARDWFQLTQEIQGNAQGAVDILDDLLNYDKIEQGTLKLGLQVLSIWQLLETAILEFKLPASSKQVKLSLTFGREGTGELTPALRATDLPQDILSLQMIGDSVRLTQVLRNLMSNALKFTNSEGSVQVRALFIPPFKPGAEQEIVLQKGEVVYGAKAGLIKVLVTDTGAGMSPDQLDKLFQDGVQFNVNQLQKGGGSGLGLYIAKGIVKQHDGTLSADSAGIGQGTTFELVLPLWKLKSDELENLRSEPSQTSLMRTSNTSLASLQSQHPLPKSPSSQFKRSLRILVVDDVKSNRKLLIRLLQNHGHECDEAENGQECLDKVEQALASGKPFQCILLDYEMPVMNGPTAATNIRQRGLDVNIVGITGNVLPDDVKFFETCGANDVLAKPVKMTHLYACWVDFFGSSKPEEAMSELSMTGENLDGSGTVGYDYNI